MWFEDLTGFAESNRQTVQKKMTVTGDKIISHINGRRMICGTLKTPSLAELRQEIACYDRPKGKTIVQEIVADVQALHGMSSNQHALFQVASQFNLLEMISPAATPEKGIGCYEDDPTQGPACAIAAGAGTIYRHYFVPLNGSMGQSSSQQIDLLADLGKVLGNQQQRLWVMQNGYVLASAKGLRELTTTINLLSEPERDALRQLLRIGVQWNTEVTLNKEQSKSSLWITQATCHDALKRLLRIYAEDNTDVSLNKAQSDKPQLVTQAYCSALPVAYSEHEAHLWQAFATLILEATYEATLCAGILNALQNGSNKVYLTLIGGGAFGNKKAWIISAIERALSLYKTANLEIYIVSHRVSNPDIQRLVDK